MNFGCLLKAYCLSFSAIWDTGFGTSFDIIFTVLFFFMTTTRSCCWACFEGEILWADLMGKMGRCIGVFVTSLEGILLMFSASWPPGFGTKAGSETKTLVKESHKT